MTGLIGTPYLYRARIAWNARRAAVADTLSGPARRVPAARAQFQPLVLALVAFQQAALYIFGRNERFPLFTAGASASASATDGPDHDLRLESDLHGASTGRAGDHGHCATRARLLRDTVEHSDERREDHHHMLVRYTWLLATERDADAGAHHVHDHDDDEVDINWLGLIVAHELAREAVVRGKSGICALRRRCGARGRGRAA